MDVEGAIRARILSGRVHANGKELSAHGAHAVERMRIMHVLRVSLQVGQADKRVRVAFPRM